MSQQNAAEPPTPSADGAGGAGSAVLTGEPLLEVRDVAKYFGSVNALQGISLKVYAGEVTCVLGDNGAGKSTLIKILSGVFQPDEGEFLIEGKPVSLAGPREARAHGIATVFQDLATIPLMSLWRNFFLGQEPTTGRGPLQRLNAGQAKTIMRSELAKMGIDVRDPNQNVGTLSGGERQALAIARAVYFGARVLILDEPTSALGVRQSGIVLKYIVQAREMGKGVIFITHNPHHAYPVGDRFYLLKRGRLMASLPKNETTIEGLTDLMAGGAELAELSKELMGLTSGAGAPDAEVAEVARELAQEAPSPDPPAPGQDQDNLSRTDRGARVPRRSSARPGRRRAGEPDAHRTESPVVTDALPATGPQVRAQPKFLLGSAPDSWGVWFPSDPLQTPWTRFLDELARAGYGWLELGPYGYLPTDAGKLRAELEARGLRLAGGTAGGPLHRRAELGAIRAQLLDVGRLAAALGAGYVVFLPAMYRDLSDGRPLEPAGLDAGQWRALVEGAGHLARVLREETGMRFVFHPHAESHVETDGQVGRFLADTDPELVGLCPDTGHVAYARGDAPRLLREHAGRIWYVHLKAVDPGVLAQVRAERLSFAEAVRRDVMCEPGRGVPALTEVIAALGSLPDGTFVIVEQDLYPCDFDRPYPIAARARQTLQAAGIG